MPNTFVKIASVTVGSGGSSTIDFTSIPQTYTDLKIVLSSRTSAATIADSVFFTFNSSTSNFTSRVMYGSGSSAASFTQARWTGSQTGANATASVFANLEIYIANYTSSNYKSFSGDAVTENNATESYQYLGAALWANTAAITSITLTPSSGSFVQYSTAVLYGIKSS